MYHAFELLDLILLAYSRVDLYNAPALLIMPKFYFEYWVMPIKLRLIFTTVFFKLLDWHHCLLSVIPKLKVKCR